MNVVYHGSPQKIESEFALPKRNKRNGWNEEKKSFEIIFDQISFHATPHKWIALAYTCKHGISIEVGNLKSVYNMGVSLYNNNLEVEIFGVRSLEDSLKALYGNGGFIYHFNDCDFFHKEGLGTLELITDHPVKPIKIERINDPVKEMIACGVNFKFTDLELPENSDFR